MFSRDRLRQALGPDKAAYDFLATGFGAFRDIETFEDDFHGVLNLDFWNVANNGTAATDFVVAAGSIIKGDAGTDDNGYISLISDATNVTWSVGKRATAIFRIRLEDAVTDTKFEVGFIDAAAAGAVNAKATPTSTATDYAVLIRDTDDDTNLSIIADGTTGAVASVDGSFTVATNTWYDLMIATNEAQEVHGWINSQYQGKISSGPDDNTGLSLWVFLQNRAAATQKDMEVDYIRAWQERVAVASQ